jgi:hypothetical protein
VKFDFLKRENLRSLIMRRKRLCIVPFLKALLLENLLCNLIVVLGGG